MKNLVVALFLSLAAPAAAQVAAPSLWLPESFGPSQSYAVGINMAPVPYACVARDVYNGMWLIGPGIEAAQLWHKDAVSGVSREYAYIGLENLYAMGDTVAGGGNGKGVLAVHLGIKLPTVALQGIGWLTQHDLQADLPPWGQYLNEIVSIEGGYGYRAAGISQQMAAQGIKKQTWDIAAQLSIPVSTVMSWIGVPGTL